MQHTVTNVLCSTGTSDSLLDITMSCAKMAEPIGTKVCQKL